MIALLFTSGKILQIYATKDNMLKNFFIMHYIRKMNQALKVLFIIVKFLQHYFQNLETLKIFKIYPKFL